MNFSMILSWAKLGNYHLNRLRCNVFLVEILPCISKEEPSYYSQLNKFTGIVFALPLEHSLIKQPSIYKAIR